MNKGRGNNPTQTEWRIHSLQKLKLSSDQFSMQVNVVSIFYFSWTKERFVDSKYLTHCKITAAVFPASIYRITVAKVWCNVILEQFKHILRQEIC